MTREQAEQLYKKHRGRTRKLVGDVDMAIAVDAIMEAVAVEREECAKVCEDKQSAASVFVRSADGKLYNAVVKTCVDVIRARGNEWQLYS